MQDTDVYMKAINAYYTRVQNTQPTQTSALPFDEGEREYNEHSSLTEEGIRTGSCEIVHELRWNIPLREILPIRIANAIDIQSTIDDLEFSVRTYNCLRRSGRLVISQILSETIYDLLQIRNMGVRSVWNIIQCIFNYANEVARTVLSTKLAENDVHPSAFTEINKEITPELRNADTKIRFFSPTSTEIIDYSKYRITQDQILSGTHMLVTALRQDIPIYFLLPAADEAGNVRASIDSIELTVRTTNCIKRLECQSIEHLLSMTVNDLLFIRNMGSKSVWNIMQWLYRRTDNELKLTNRTFPPEPDIQLPAHFETEPDPLLNLSDEVDMLIFDLIVSKFQVNVKNILSEFNITSLAELVSFCSQNQFLSESIRDRVKPILNLLRQSTQLMNRQEDHKSLISHIYYILHDKPFPATILNSVPYGEVARRITVILSDSPVSAQTFILRSSNLTLEETGKRLSLSRERVRQIEKSVFQRLESHPGFVNWSVKMICNIVMNYGGCIGIDEIGSEIFDDKRTGQVVDASRFIKFLAELPSWQSTELEIIYSTIQLKNRWEMISKIINRVAFTAARKWSDNERGVNVWSTPLNCVLDEITSIINAEFDDQFNRVNLSREAFASAISESKGLIRLDGDRIYSTEYWNLLYGSKLSKIETILKVAGRPLHHSEITDEFRRWSPDGADARGALERSNDIILWGRGTYLHRIYIQLPHEVLKRIANWIDIKLLTGVPYISVAGAFEYFKEDCLESGLLTAHSLYSSIGLLFPHKYLTKEYPYIAQEHEGGLRTPVNVLIEEYVQGEGGFVTRNSVTEFVSKSLGVDIRLAPMYIGLTPNLLAGYRQVIHSDNLQVDDSVMNELISVLTEQLVSRSQVSVFELLESRKILRLRLGIDDNKLIHSLIISRTNGLISGTYPHLALAENSAEIKSSVEIVVDFIRELHRPCSLYDLKQFADKRALGDQILYASSKHARIIPYSKDTLIHLDLMAWDEYKQSLLEQTATSEYFTALKTGRYFTTVRNLLENYETDLPSLDPIIWTRTLIAHLLHRSNRWLFLGNAMDAYVPLDNNQNIKNLDDYLAMNITHFHSGACRLDTLEEELRDSGIITKRLTPQMLGKSSKVIIDGGDIMLRKLRDAQ